MSHSVKKVHQIIVIISVICLNSLPVRAWEGKGVWMADGDSFAVKRGHREYKIRLYGVDSPEYGQAYWRDAKRFTRALVQGKTVTVEPVERDRYGRIVALVWSGGRLVNRELVQNGMAWVYPHYCKAQPLCADMTSLQRGARQQRIGLWRGKSPMPPWRWKRKRAKR
jgi:endonuclease YncB( thermonuclease family)